VAKRYGGKGHNYVRSIIQTDDGGILFAGSCDSGNSNMKVHGKNDAWVVKLDALGAMKWEHCYGGSNSDGIVSIVQTRAGESPEYMFVGSSSSIDGDVTGNHIVPVYSDPSADVWVGKINNQGILIWEKSIGGKDRDLAYGLIKSSNGNVLFAGWTESPDGDIHSNPGGIHMWLVELHDSSIVREQCYGNRGGEALTLCQTMDGGYVLGGTFDSVDHSYLNQYQNNGALIKIDGSGKELWHQSFGGSGHDGFYCVSPTTDGGVITTGYTNSDDGDLSGHASSPFYDALIVKYAINGNFEWKTTFGGSSNDMGGGIFQTADNGYIFIGGAETLDGDIKVDTIRSAWLVKLTFTAGVTPTADTKEIAVLPNPASEKLLIKYESIDPLPISIEVLDVLGHCVIKSTDEQTSSGNREQLLDLKRIPSGTYILKLQSSSHTIIRKIVKL
jgi:hypothetical protein